MYSTKQRDFRRPMRRRKKRRIWLWVPIFVALTVLSLIFLYAKNKAAYYDVAIINAVVHEGTKDGNSFSGGVGIKGDKIAKVWRGRSWLKPRAGLIIDAKGADLSPGFIDTHSHADLSISNSGPGKVRADNFIGQGVTTVIVGNCGRSHSDIPSLAKSFDKRKSNINIATLIGLNAVRKKVMQESSAAASVSEIARMSEIVKAGMKAGALGVSTGLAYPPGIFASRAEMSAQLKIAKEFGGIHTTHMRSEGGEITKAVDEVIDISKSADIPLLISHYKVTGLKNCGQFDATEKLIAQARGKGMKIYLDYYPYDASSTNLNIFLPDWYLALDRKSKAKFLTAPAGRAKLADGVKEILHREGFNDFKFASVSYYAPHRDWQGKALDEIARLQRKSTTSALDTQVDIFLEMEQHGGAQMVYHNICPDIMDRIPQEEENMVGTDSAIRNDNSESLPHPRGWGAFPRFIRYFVNEKKLLSLDEAIYRMSGLPAKVFKFSKRGTIEEKFFADIVIFDSKALKDGATYDDPFQPPVGIKYVLVNGKIVVNNGKGNNGKRNALPLETYPGVFIKRGSL